MFDVKKPPSTHCCKVMELRQYTLRAGRRDELIALFEREFIESQEAQGITLPGQFRDLDNPDRFVWLRGFSDMPERAEALAAFYGGPTWQAHRNAANATMLDSDNVLVLRPARADSAFATSTTTRPLPGAGRSTGGIVVATLYYFESQVDARFVEYFHDSVVPLLSSAGAEVLSAFETETASNNFPRLPVREGEHIFVWFARFDHVAAYERFREALAAMPRWTQVRAGIDEHLMREEVLRLAPTERSLLPSAQAGN
ncbi:MAG: NIPSNAP family protein [Pseudomonadota bacterium]|nr:NIPSNAP family protein [Pseudomonadota bacterium]